VIAASPLLRRSLRSAAIVCSSRKRSSPLRLPVILDVALERPGRRELAELVPDHRLGGGRRNMLTAVVHRERVPDHVGNDRRAARPGLDDLLRVLLVLRVDLLQQMVVDERALLQAAWHLPSSPSLLFAQALIGLPMMLLAGAPASDDELVARFVCLTGAALRLAPRAHRVSATRGLALTAAVRVVHRVHHDAADAGALAFPPHASGLAPVDVGLLGVTDLADRGTAAYVDAADLTAGHTQRRVAALLAEQLDARACRPGELRTAAGTQLDRVDQRARRDVAQ